MVIVKKETMIFLVIFILFFFAISNSWSENIGESSEPIYTKEFGIFSGWASGELKRQDDYNMIPLHLQIGFDITSVLNKINIKPKGNLRFAFEPFFNTIVSPDSNVEVGNDFILKYSHPIIRNFFIYIECGLGMMFTSQHTAEQSTQFNFTDQGGAGISYLFSKNKSINFGYRFRHFSNAGIKSPNKGVDMDYFLCGMSVLY